MYINLYFLGTLPPASSTFPELTLIEQHLVAPFTPVITGVKLALSPSRDGDDNNRASYSIIHYSTPSLCSPTFPLSVRQLASRFMLLNETGTDLLPCSQLESLSVANIPNQLTVRHQVMREAVTWLKNNSIHFRDI